MTSFCLWGDLNAQNKFNFLRVKSVNGTSDGLHLRFSTPADILVPAGRLGA